MGNCNSKKCNISELSLRDQVKATRDMIVTHGSEISTSAYYSSPRLSSELPDCSLCLTFDHLSACHPEGTLITKSNGEQIPIEEIKIGDHVTSFHELKGLVSSKVENLFVRETEEMLKLETSDGSILFLTPEHPVYVKSKGWVLAKDLSTKDMLLKIK